MAYQNYPTVETPAHVLFLIDASKSMAKPLLSSPGPTPIEIVQDALLETLLLMAAASADIGTNGALSIVPLFNVAVVLYNDTVEDLYNGFQSIQQIIDDAHPLTFPCAGTTHMFRAFQHVKAFYVFRVDI